MGNGDRTLWPRISDLALDEIQKFDRRIEVVSFPMPRTAYGCLCQGRAALSASKSPKRFKRDFVRCSCVPATPMERKTWCARQWSSGPEFQLQCILAPGIILRDEFSPQADSRTSAKCSDFLSWREPLISRPHTFSFPRIPHVITGYWRESRSTTLHLSITDLTQSPNQQGVQLSRRYNCDAGLVNEL